MTNDELVHRSYEALLLALDCVCPDWTVYMIDNVFCNTSAYNMT